MKIANIGNLGRKIYLFIRHSNGELEIKEDDFFFPYYYDENPDGDFISYNGKKLKKHFVSKPSDIKKQAGSTAWESDVKFPVRYLIDKIDTIEKTNIKYSFIDLEMLCSEFPDPIKAEYPISCISSSNSFTDKITTFYLGDYDSEYNMIDAFINYMQIEKYDLVLGWNFEGFDYPYLYNHIPNFSKSISPIGQERFMRDNIRYPIGTSIVDYMLLDKKITLNRKREYSLNARLFETIGREKQIKKIDFSKLSPELKQRNIDDVRDMMLMEKKLQYIPMLDRIRRISKIQWEDYQYNSRVIDNLLLSEARKKKIVLPNKPKKEDGGEDFEGAFRDVFKKGRLFDITCYDLSGAYLNTIIELCLDPVNVYTEKIENSTLVNVTDRITQKIKATYNIKQNSDTLLPIVAKKLLDEKNKFKELLKNIKPSSPEFKDIEEKYKAWKGVSLSTWGVIGNKYFRYYRPEVCSMITSVVRDVLHYVIDEIKKLGYEMLYVDTDGILVDTKGENISNLVNEFVQKWSQERYKRNTKISFDYEGNYEKLFIVALTRYKGYLRRPDGTLEEKIVGIEAKRKNSTFFIKYFQTELLEKLMNKEPKADIINWVKNEIKELRNKPLQNIAFPNKLAGKDYKSLPIWKRALDSTEGFEKKTGSLFYWLYIKPIKEPKVETHVYIDDEIYEILKKDISKKEIIITYTKQKIDEKRIKVLHKKDKPINVQAFDEEKFEHIDRNIVDWELMIKRNIINKVEVIFEAMGWDIKEINPNYVETKNEIAEYIKNLKKDKQIVSAEEVSREKRLSSTKESEVQVLASAPILKEKFNEIQKEKSQTNITEQFSKDNVKIKEITFKEASDFIKNNHYSHTMPVTNLFLGFSYKDKLNCVVVYGTGACYRLKKSLPNPNFLELVRLFSEDNAPKNMESYCISQSIKYLKKHKPDIKILVSFADPSQGHVGYIYQATNWIYTGLTLQAGNAIYKVDGVKIHPRTLLKKYKTTSKKEALEFLKQDNPNSIIEKVKNSRKHRYIMFIGNKKENKEMNKKLKYKILSYPKINKEG